MRGKPAAQVEELPVGSPAETTPSQLICPTDAPATIVPFAVQSIEMDPGVTSAGLGRAPSPRPFPTHSGSTQLDSHTDMIFAYFDFLETETLSHIAPEDVKFLEYKGCFHIPQRPILDDLVREYFLHVHPVLPVLDERLFWEIYIPGGSRTGCRKVPLFVFRAMLFVSCSVSDFDRGPYLSLSNGYCVVCIRQYNSAVGISECTRSTMLHVQSCQASLRFQYHL